MCLCFQTQFFPLLLPWCQVRSSLGYWHRLPYQMCRLRPEEGPEGDSGLHSGPCWNGTAEGRYRHAIVEDGFESQVGGDPTNVGVARGTLTLGGVTWWW